VSKSYIDTLAAVAAKKIIAGTSKSEIAIMITQEMVARRMSSSLDSLMKKIDKNLRLAGHNTVIVKTKHPLADQQLQEISNKLGITGAVYSVEQSTDLTGGLVASSGELVLDLSTDSTISKINQAIRKEK
jgi:F0F1-type ATP synthase delta subunit